MACNFSYIIRVSVSPGKHIFPSMSTVMPATGTQDHRTRTTGTATGSSPIKRNLQGTLPHSAQISSAAQIRKALAEEMAGHWVGPMPVQDFLNEFVPLASDTTVPPLLTDHFRTMPPSPKRESEMYPPFVSYDTNYLFASGCRDLTSIIR